MIALKSAAELMLELEAAPWLDRVEIRGAVAGQICPLCGVLVSSTGYYGRTVVDYRARHIAWHGHERALLLEAGRSHVVEVGSGLPGTHHVSPEGPVRRAAHDIGGQR